MITTDYKENVTAELINARTSLHVAVCKYGKKSIEAIDEANTCAIPLLVKSELTNIYKKEISDEITTASNQSLNNPGNTDPITVIMLIDKIHPML